MFRRLSAVGLLLLAIPVAGPTSAETDCFGSWTQAPSFYVGKKIDRLLSDKRMTVSENACANFSHARYVIIANPNGNVGVAPHVR